MPRPSKKSQEEQMQEVRRNYVIHEAGVQNPCDAFIDDYLAPMEGRARAATPDKETYDPSERYPVPPIDTAAAQYPKPDYTIESLAGLDPNDPRAKEIVLKIMGIEDASPALIMDIMRGAELAIPRSGAPSPEPISNYTYICLCEINNIPTSECPHVEGEVTVLAHEPGVNDIAAGGLPRQNGYRSSVSPVVMVPVSPQDRVACKAEWDALAKFQPNRLVSLQMLKDERLWTEELLDRLPMGFHTTVTGLVRALDEIELVGESGHREVVLNALFVRGGEPASDSAAVIYAEELVPYIREGETGYDAVFWETIDQMRRENTSTGIVDLLAWAAM